MSGIDPEHEFKGDPFFEIIHDGEWNATLGRQGHEENYLDGYIEAAIELADAIVEKRLYGKRDTLILPILYNARHATELNIKFAYNKLVSSGAIQDGGLRINHNISLYWQHLYESKIGDIELRRIIDALKIFVQSMARIDSDGQELRYHINSDNNRSLEKFATVNLIIVQMNLRELKEHLHKIKLHTIRFVDERTTETFTNSCSRSDLMAIAKELPPRDQWADPTFNDIKLLIKEKYGLSSRKLSEALDKIQKSRELSALINIETPLLYLTDDDVIWVAEQWRRLHPKRNNTNHNNERLIFNMKIDFSMMKERSSILRDVTDSINKRICNKKISELETMFYLEINCPYPEFHDELTIRNAKNISICKNSASTVKHLLEKTNFLENLSRSSMRLGRIKLAEKLKNI
ncbi:hypothetical protein [Magnetospirillum fulvum]|uniref:hypothetical protein n=1 Tax=Magnetospirillum fulvum TaxID=1082 RepID=UPI0005875761|nr:hypothetical protein [Magnetospirillum fulvum]